MEKVCAMTGSTGPLVEVAIPDLRLRTTTTLLSREALDLLAQHIFTQRGRAAARKAVLDRKRDEATGRGVEADVLATATKAERQLVESGQCPKCREIIRGFRAVGTAQRELYETLKANGINPSTGHRLECPVQAFKIGVKGISRVPAAAEMRSDGEATMKKVLGLS